MPKKVTYDPLWKTLRARNMNKGDFQEEAHLFKGTITKMGKDESVTVDVISRIATVLDTKDIRNQGREIREKSKASIMLTSPTGISG